MKKKKLLTDKTNGAFETAVEEAGRAMAREIDREVLWGMLEALGWTRVILSRNNNLHINIWLSKNCKGAFEYSSNDYLFEDAKDANWFKLRWLA